MMKLSLSINDVSAYVAKQISVLYPDRTVSKKEMLFFMKETLARTEYCFSKINNKYFNKDGKTVFNHLNTDQYAMFLYFLSNTIWITEKNGELASKVYYLNKTLNSLEVFYEVALPDIFLFSHPIGTVLGRGKYSDYFVCHQGCTVGGNKDLEYPQIGKGVAMYTGSSLIGRCKISDNSLISIGAILIDKEMPPDAVIFGQHPNVSHKHTTKSVIERYFIK